MLKSNKEEKTNILKDVDVPSKFPYPYTPEKFTKKEKKVLLNFFTNWDKPIFAIHNLPQEVIGAMFSRYSRTAKSVRRLFLDEFWNQEEELASARRGLVELGNLSFPFAKAKERTRDFYQKVFAESIFLLNLFPKFTAQKRLRTKELPVPTSKSQPAMLISDRKSMITTVLWNLRKSWSQDLKKNLSIGIYCFLRLIQNICLR